MNREVTNMQSKLKSLQKPLGVHVCSSSSSSSSSSCCANSSQLQVSPLVHPGGSNKAAQVPGPHAAFPASQLRRLP